MIMCSSLFESVKFALTLLNVVTLVAVSIVTGIYSRLRQPFLWFGQCLLIRSGFDWVGHHIDSNLARALPDHFLSYNGKLGNVD